MKFSFRATLLFCVFVFQAGLVNADTIKVISFPIPLMVESESEGVFIDLVKEIDNRIDYDVEISVYPTKRTVSMFHEGAVDGFFPALDVVLGKPVSKSANIYIKEDFGFVKNGNTPPTSVDGLKGKSVGLTAGYPYVKEISDLQEAKIGFAQTDEKNVQKLVAGRIEVFVVEEKSGLKAIQNAGAQDAITYNKESPLSQQDVYFAFQNTPEGKKQAAAFSTALEAMKADGTFKKIMSQAGK